MNFKEYYLVRCRRIEQVLESILPSAKKEPERLHSAMRYAVLGGGKRLRPLLVYAAGEMLAVPLANLDTAAAAVELIHAYSLIHDDLPAMDNDAWRRGQATCHKAFDEATAILAGNALHTLAFTSLLEDHAYASELRLQLLQCLAKACSSTALLGGQMLDMQANHSTTLAELEAIHCAKTGALIQASIQLPTLIANCKQAEIVKLEDYANAVGLAFQIQDDLFDHTEESKQQLTANVAGKPSYPTLLGVNQCQSKVQELYTRALNSIAAWGKQSPLYLLTDYMQYRRY
jgi:farnesyl diphosphate synthase